MVTVVSDEVQLYFPDDGDDTVAAAMPHTALRIGVVAGPQLATPRATVHAMLALIILSITFYGSYTR